MQASSTAANQSSERGYAPVISHHGCDRADYDGTPIVDELVRTGLRVRAEAGRLASEAARREEEERLARAATASRRAQDEGGSIDTFEVGSMAEKERLARATAEAVIGPISEILGGEAAEVISMIEQERLAREAADAARRREEEEDKQAREAAKASQRIEQEALAQAASELARRAEAERKMKDLAEAARIAEEEKLAQAVAEVARRQEQERRAREAAEAAKRAELERLAREVREAADESRRKAEEEKLVRVAARAAQKEVEDRLSTEAVDDEVTIAKEACFSPQSHTSTSTIASPSDVIHVASREWQQVGETDVDPKCIPFNMREQACAPPSRGPRAQIADIAREAMRKQQEHMQRRPTLPTGGTRRDRLAAKAYERNTLMGRR